MPGKAAINRMSHHNAPARLVLPLLLALAAAWVGPTLALAGEREPSADRVLAIEEAIDIAKRCVIDREIRVVGSFIESARFERNPRGDRGSFWRVTWAYSREIKGGRVFVTVYSNRTCEVTHGQ
jgi:hypothetical protein